MNILRWMAILIVICGVIGGLGYYKYVEISNGIAEAANYPEHSEATEATVSSFVLHTPETSVIGEVVAPEWVTLRSQKAGKIAKLGFQPGEDVTNGQLLVQLDVSEETARLKGAKADAELARISLERAEKLGKSGSISQSRIDTLQANLDTALANVGIIESTIDQKTIRAPFAGKSNAGNLVVGQYINIDETLAEIVSDKPTLWIDFRLPQTHHDLPIGTEISVALKGKAPVAGTLISRDGSVSSENRTRLHRAQIRTSDLTAPHGAFVVVKVPASEQRQLVKLPVSALRSDAYGQFVYSIEQAEQEGTYRAKRHDVDDVTFLADQVLIGTGLKADLQIATNGSFKLYPGILTRVVDALPAEEEPADNWN
ncbi:efflux RND transporter periplasmic adaptor subunit [Roseibium sp. SCP14]|uniref:efflux RND transporter periplasmic adaptor subunit n=1 Tax=Roseibium sp. SCP14 TaxID=3141375 RepID=UPI0033368BAC